VSQSVQHLACVALLLPIALADCWLALLVKSCERLLHTDMGLLYGRMHGSSAVKTVDDAPAHFGA
jgi:hypothetical protein